MSERAYRPFARQSLNAPLGADDGDDVSASSSATMTTVTSASGRARSVEDNSGVCKSGKTKLETRAEYKMLGNKKTKDKHQKGGFSSRKDGDDD